KSSTEQAEDSLEGMLRVERQVDLAKMGAKAPTGDNINKNNIIKALEGTTTQSTKIAQAIKNGDIKVSILGDELFDRYFGEELALAVGDKIYLRKSSGSLLSETVHEGTHALDFRNMYGFEGTKTEWQWEKRAWFYERQFQKATGGKVEFEKIEDMLMHIYLNYKNKPYNPYE
ncbi:hypothetical protein, partial [Brevibacillus borstelensis]